MLPPILTLVLLVFAVALGTRVRKPGGALPMLVVVWAVVMIVNFVVAGVADDGDVGAFVVSAGVVLILCAGLWRLGDWLAHRRSWLSGRPLLGRQRYTKNAPLGPMRQILAAP